MNEEELTEEQIEYAEWYLREVDDSVDESCVRDQLLRAIRYEIPFKIYSAAFTAEEANQRPRAGRAADMIEAVLEAVLWGAENVKAVRSVMQVEDHEEELRRIENERICREHGA